MPTSRRKGFTLVEVLIIIGVLAALVTITLLVINPAELFRQSRDYKRISDLTTTNKALQLYGLTGASFGSTSTIYVSIPDDAAIDPVTKHNACPDLTLPDITPKVYACANTANLRNLDTTGWIPVNFNALPSGSPFSNLPIDPINDVTAGNYYTYAVGSWELTAKMESTKYNAGGKADVVTKDGGIGDGRLEIGTDLTLAPLAIVGSEAQGGGPGGGGAPPPASPNPVASFTASPISGTAPLSVNFTDTSTNNPTSWDWDFGDGSAHAATQNTSHSYTAGSWTTTLTVNGGSFANQAITATAAPTAPGSPTGLAATPGNAQITLNWAAPSSNGGSAITGYNVYRGTTAGGESGTPLQSGGCSALGNVLTCIDAGLANGTAYFYKVTAVNAVGESPPSAEANATPSVPAPPGLYWAGGMGNWSDTTKWNNETGTACSCVPDATKDVYFNVANSNVTIDIAASAKSMDWTGATGGTLAGSQSLNIAGSLKFIAGISLSSYSGTITFSSTTAGQTITSAGLNLPNITFDGVGGSWTLQDDLSLGTNTITLTNGTFSTNSKIVNAGVFSSSNSNARTLTLGSSSFTVTANTTIGTAWNISTATNFTLNAGTSTITLTGATPSSSSATANVGTTTNTYYNMTFTNTSTTTLSGTGATFNNLTRTNTTSSRTWQFNVGGNFTINGTLKLNGTSTSPSTGRLFVKSSSPGTARTLTAATTDLLNVDFTDITAAGTATWAGTSIGNGLGNTGITFTTATTRYWVGNGGSWSSTAHWATSSNGVSGATVPLAQDTVIFDASSFSSPSQTITTDISLLGSISFAGASSNPVLNTPTWNIGSNTVYIFGSVTLVSGMNIGVGTNSINFYARSAVTLTSAGKTFNGQTTIDAAGGTITLQDALNINNTFTVGTGTFNANGFNVTATSFTSNSGRTRAVTMGSGTWTVTGTGGWTVSTSSLTLTANTSTITLTDSSSTGKTFAGGGTTYYNLALSGTGTGAFTISGNNIFNDFKDTDSVAHSILFTAASNQTVTTFTVSGTAGNLITLNSTSTGTFSLTSSGAISRDYLNIQHSVAIGTGTWHAGSHSVNNQGVATAGNGWIFP